MAPLHQPAALNRAPIRPILCGAVAFTAKLDLAQGTRRCNCSICTKARAWFAIVKADELTLQKGEEHLADYSWTPPGGPKVHLHCRFCKTCGIRAFARGEQEDLGGTFYAIAIAALDDIEVDSDQLASSITYVEGRHDEYSKAPADKRLM
ncbi:GFA family protein [Pyxidicoccus xibeiensis]|uniref:GFA family protein n=1 Tax=Pyxidicoccus xibeiensis TaxID=2906759 RepID=UPI0020A7BE58|nr:GFA family protein [Pyxidicoccus xibeiensis]MCP3143587.1 GFA family protein [Pyxidicoccus xibeiensis]